MLPSSPAFEGGLADPVTDAQSVFHAVMHAMANPGRIYPLAAAATPPQPLTPELGVISATLLDHDATVWCDAAIAANEDATAWLTFHTGAPRVENADAAQFALVSDVSRLPSLADFSQGNAEFPDRSTTIVLAVASLKSGQGFVLKGPGSTSMVCPRISSSNGVKTVRNIRLALILFWSATALLQHFPAQPEFLLWRAENVCCRKGWRNGHPQCPPSSR